MLELKLKPLLPFCVFVTMLVMVMIFQSSNCLQKQNKPEITFRGKQPMNDTLLFTEDTILPCFVDNLKRGMRVIWTKNGVALPDKQMPGKNYFCRRNYAKGDFSLAISPINLEDEARFQCQVMLGPFPILRSSSAYLSVEVEPTDPKISQGTHIRVPEGEFVKLECMSLAGRPAPIMTWLDGNGEEIVNGLINATKLQVPVGNPERAVNFTWANLTHQVTRKNKEGIEFLTCQMIKTNKSPQVTRIVSASIEVHIMPPLPEVSLEIHPNSLTGPHSLIHEFEDVTMTCRARPRVNHTEHFHYIWFVNGHTLPVIAFSLCQKYSTNMSDEGYVMSVVLFKVNRKLNGSIITCQVHNYAGQAEVKRRLKILYEPDIMVLPETVIVDKKPGDLLAFDCNVNGAGYPCGLTAPKHEVAKITWYHYNIFGHPPEHYFPEPNGSVVITLEKETAGVYQCMYHLSGHPYIATRIRTPNFWLNETEEIKEDDNETLWSCFLVAASVVTIVVAAAICHPFFPSDI